MTQIFPKSSPKAESNQNSSQNGKPKSKSKPCGEKSASASLFRMRGAEKLRDARAKTAANPSRNCLNVTLMLSLMILCVAEVVFGVIGLNTLPQLRLLHGVGTSGPSSPSESPRSDSEMTVFVYLLLYSLQTLMGFYGTLIALSDHIGLLTLLAWLSALKVLLNILCGVASWASLAVNVGVYLAAFGLSILLYYDENDCHIDVERRPLLSNGNKGDVENKGAIDSRNKGARCPKEAERMPLGRFLHV